MAKPSHLEALSLIDEALARDGRSPEQLRLVVLLGSGGGALLEALRERAPALPKVLVLEPDAAAASRLHELKPSDAGWQGRLVVFGPEQLQPAQEHVGAYLTLGQFVLGSQLATFDVTCVVDPATAEGPQGRVLQAALADLTRGLSREFLRQVAGRREFAGVLSGIAKYFAAHGEPYHALKFYSSVAPQQMTAELVQAAFACLLALGNVALTEHWLSESPLDEASRQFLRGQIPPESRPRHVDASARLERNLSFLLPHFPAAVASLRESGPAPDLFAIELGARPWLLRAGGGVWSAERRPYTLFVRAQGLRLTEENPLDELAELQAALVACAARGQDHVWLGRFVKYAQVAINVISQPSLLTLHGWRRVTFLQEEDTAALVSFLGAVELEPWFDAAQVRLLVGSSAVDQLAQGLEENLHQAVPELGIGVSPEARKQVITRRFRKLSRAPELFDALERRYRQHPERLLGVLQDRSRPLRVVLMTSRYTTVLQHVTRDLADAFGELGHTTTVLWENRSGEEMIAFGVAERLLELEPDFVFLLDHIRPEYAQLLPSGLPVVTWVLDELPALKDQRAIAQLGSLDLAYGFNGAIQRGFQQLGYPHVGRLPFAVNPARYVAEPPLASASGIGFTTHIGQFSKDPAGAPGLNAQLAARFDREPEIPLEMFRIEPLLDAAMAELGLEASADAQRHLLYHGLMLARQQDRERVAQAVVQAGLPLTVYGLGWDTLPEFADKQGGVVATGAALRQVYRQHRAVLHINRGCNIHPRVLETMCSGGLVIARWDPLDDLPGETCDELGDALCQFRDRREMVSLLRRAIDDDTFRTDLILRGQARVLEHHTYQARARKVIGDLAGLLEQHLRVSAASTPASPALNESAHA